MQFNYFPPPSSAISPNDALTGMHKLISTTLSVESQGCISHKQEQQTTINYSETYFPWKKV